MKPLRIALDYLDWSAGGGRHFTAHLTFEDYRERVEMERPISVRESKVLYPDHGDRFYCLPLARKTNRFETKEDLVRFAANWCETNIEGDYILMSSTRGDLTQILASKGVPETRVRILNLIWEQSNKAHHWYWDSQTMDTFYGMWREWAV